MGQLKGRAMTVQTNVARWVPFKGHRCAASTPVIPVECCLVAEPNHSRHPAHVCHQHTVVQK